LKHISGGLNVGSATGATTGQVKASGDVFALNKGKGLQAQLVDYTIIDGTAWANLSTSYTTAMGCTANFLFTPGFLQIQRGLVIGDYSSANITFIEDTATPSAPPAGLRCLVYMKADKLVVLYNDGGTARYKYLDLTGTGVTWAHTTTAP
jgi:hypothetical protein